MSADNSLLARPEISSEEALKLIYNLYGFSGIDIAQLNGYDDKNFKISVGNRYENKFVKEICKDGYVLKITNTLDSKDEEFIDGSNKMMLYLGKSSLNIR